MLVNKRRAVVDLVVDDEVEVLLGVVLGDFGEGEFFVGHCVVVRFCVVVVVSTGDDRWC